MKEISKKEIIEKIKFENPWWGEIGSIDEYFRKMRSRAYLEGLLKLLHEDIQRAIVLMGPRRVGKTVLLYHAIQKLIGEGVDPKRICYISIEAPVYIGLRLEQILKYYSEIFDFPDLKGCYVFFDEIQYLKNWEVHLKKLVDDYRGVKFVASGSAAAALRLKSMESGAGRFTDIYLPPLMFSEYLDLTGKEEAFKKIKDKSIPDESLSEVLLKMNGDFINYINFGGYPEALFSEPIKADPGRFIRSDIVDKVLLRDLPSLYGIQDIQELNRLFTTIAYNTGNEMSLDELSQNSGVAKNTIKKYLEYLKAAFLIRIVHRVDQSGKRFKRANYFKAYLTNPSMRCALFGSVSADHEFMGNMVETAVMSQVFHLLNMVFYARWNDGEVDMIIGLDRTIAVCAEIKWTNRFVERPEELKSLVRFSQGANLSRVFCTTIDLAGKTIRNGITIIFLPAVFLCYALSERLGTFEHLNAGSLADLLKRE